MRINELREEVLQIGIRGAADDVVDYLSIVKKIDDLQGDLESFKDRIRDRISDTMGKWDIG